MCKPSISEEQFAYDVTTAQIRDLNRWNAHRLAACNRGQRWRRPVLSKYNLQGLAGEKPKKINIKLK